MAQEALTLQIRPRGKPLPSLPSTLSISLTSTTSDLHTHLAAASHVSPSRLRITKGSDGSLITSSRSTPLSTTGLRHNSTITIKDLGPQIAWRTVFLIEYLGPILIHPLLYSYFTSGQDVEASLAQTLVLWMVVGHFVKRELETLFVHRFSAATMPVANVFKNSAHYWLLSGVNMAYWNYLPNSPTAANTNPLIVYSGFLLFALGELGNLVTHLELRSLRSSGGTERGIPNGLGFSLVTCPNYMFETVAWTGILLVSWSLSTLIFVVVAVGQMGLWAKKKEARYRKEFPGKYKAKRSSILPGIW